MQAIVLDFETKDPYLDKKIGLGPGWVYKLSNTNALSFAVGYSYCMADTETKEISESKYLAANPVNIEKLKDLLKTNTNVVMHNATYDLGYLRTFGINITNLKVFDTKIMARLFDNNLMSYSLDNLSKLYLKEGSQKEKDNLVKIVTDHKLITMSEDRKSYASAAMKFAYANMDVLQEKDFDSMARYANQDTVATGKLFLKYVDKLGIENSHYWSHFQLICTKIREKGIDIDMDSVHRSIETLTPIEKEREQAVWKLAGKEFNINSPAQLAKILEVKSTARFSLEQMNTPLTKSILEYREVNKILRDFLISVRDMQIYTCPEAAHGGSVGKVFPEMNLFGAVTGRFSSSCPNIQQIPKRSKDFGNLCRGMFIPKDKDQQWYSLDWSNQEGRLAVHYASLINAKGATQIAQLWRDDPKLDMHQKVADMANIQRAQAKAINLGLIYSKGQASLCRELGLDTEIINTSYGPREVAGEAGQRLLKSYQKANPWLKDLNDLARNTIKTNGFIKTLKGRILRREDPRFDYKALNKLIQGSAADQMLAALRAADDAGIDIKCIVHDEFNVEGLDSAKKMKEIMESIVELKVPMVTEVKVGTSWGNLKDVELD